MSNKQSPVSANRPKLHHFIPEMTLRRFADDDGKLHVFDKRMPHRGIIGTTPKNIFAETHLYSEILDDGTRNPALEEELSGVEGDADSVISKVIEQVRADQFPELSEKDVSIWNKFFIIQWCRAPDVREKATTPEEFDERLDTILAKLKLSNPENVEEIAELENPEARRRIIHNAKLDAIKTPKLRMNALMKSRGIGVARIMAPNKSFVIGSNPIAAVSYGSGTNMLSTDSEAWLPVASDIAIGLGKDRGTELVFKVTDHAWIQHVNEHIVDQSSMFASKSAALTHSLVKPR